MALEAASLTDFALWGGLIPGNLQHLAELSERGAVGFKAFLANSGLPEFPRADDLTLYEGMREAARLGRPVAVHAESEEITGGLARRLLAEGRHDIPAFLESRPVIAEVEAIRRAASLARETGCALHIVHISSGQGVAAALEARSLGADISLETCPHYLFFTEEDLLQIGALAKCAPPLRSGAERDDLLRRALHGEIDIIGSDHSPCPPMMKNRESFFEVWGGIAGVQSTLQVLFAVGFDSARIAATTAANPARRFKLPRRGAIEAGNFADLAFSRFSSQRRTGTASSPSHQSLCGPRAERRHPAHHPPRRDHLRRRRHRESIERSIHSCLTRAPAIAATTSCSLPIRSFAPRCRA